MVPIVHLTVRSALCLKFERKLTSTKSCQHRTYIFFNQCKLKFTWGTLYTIYSFRFGFPVMIIYSGRKQRIHLCDWNINYKSGLGNIGLVISFMQFGLVPWFSKHLYVHLFPFTGLINQTQILSSKP